MTDTNYARCGDLSLAYKVFEGGPINLVLASSFVSHVELMAADPVIRGFIDALLPFATVVLFDKAGVGLSDPVPKVRSLEDRVAEIEAVMDAAKMQSAAIMGISEGGPAAILLAASRPGRVNALVLAGTFGVSQLPDLTAEHVSAEALSAAYTNTLGVAVLPPARLERMSRFLTAVRDEWGSGVAMGQLAPSIGSKAKLGMLERMSASPGMVRATIAAATRIDVREVLPAVRVPTLVLHAIDDAIPVEAGRLLAAGIPGAQLVEMPGSDHAPWLSNPDRFLAEMQRFLTGAQRVGTTRRALRTVLFTDIVASTQHAAALGDASWHAALEQVDTATRDAVLRHGGEVVKATGDGHLATFDGPAQAIACTAAIRDALVELDLEIRQGVHTGECELLGDDIGGMAVHIAARVMGQAGAGEVLVSGTVRDLVVGSGLGFEDRGERELKGVPGMWRLLAVRREGAVTGSPEATLAAMATPGADTAMRRSDRMAAFLAKRAPRVVRTIARVAG